MKEDDEYHNFATLAPQWLPPYTSYLYNDQKHHNVCLSVLPLRLRYVSTIVNVFLVLSFLLSLSPAAATATQQQQQLQANKVDHVMSHHVYHDVNYLLQLHYSMCFATYCYNVELSFHLSCHTGITCYITEPQPLYLWSHHLLYHSPFYHMTNTHSIIAPPHVVS